MANRLDTTEQSDEVLNTEKREQYFNDLESTIDQFIRRFDSNFTPRERFVTDGGGLYIDGQIQGIEEDEDFEKIRDELSKENAKGLVVHNFGFEYYPEGHPDNPDFTGLRATGLLEARDGHSGEKDTYDLIIDYDLDEQEWAEPRIS